MTLQALDEAVNGLELGLDGHLNALAGEILDTALRLAAGSDDDTEALVNIASHPPGSRPRPPPEMFAA